MITFEGVEIDTGRLFQFDHLKQVIELLCKEMTAMKEKLEGMDKDKEVKERMLNELDEKIIGMGAKLEKRVKTVEVELGRVSATMKKGKETAETKQPDESKKEVTSIVIQQDKTDDKKDINKDNVYLKEEAFEIPSITKERPSTLIEKETDKSQEDIVDYSHKEEDANLQQGMIQFIPSPKETKHNPPNADESKHNEPSHQEEPLDKTIESHVSLPKALPSKSIPSPDSTRDKANYMELITSLFKKVKDLETQIKALEDNGKSLSKETKSLIAADYKIASKVKESNEDFANQIALLNKKYEDLLMKNIQTEEALDGLKVKVADFNVFELFKDSGNGTVDAAKAMIVTLETKVFKKFALIDDKLKEAALDIHKMKTEASNNKNNLDLSMRNSASQKEEIAELRKAQDDTLAGLRLIIDELMKTVQLNYSELLELITRNKSNGEDQLQNSIEEMRELIHNQKANSNQPASLGTLSHEANEGNGLTGEEKKLLKDINRKLFDLETAYRLKMSSFDANAINQSIKDFQSELSTKITQLDLKELYELHGVNVQAIQDLKTIFQTMIDENRKIQSDMSSLIKKIESLAGTVAILQSVPRVAEAKGPAFDISEYIDQAKFLESTKALQRELEKLRRDDEEQKRLIDDLIEKVKELTTNESVKLYQDTFNQTINELKLLLGRKYVDKTDLSKAIKGVELEIKLIADSGKKAEGDNWLLAKRPLNGYQCASCETHIPTLANQSNEYVPWNKYPTRDEKAAYRMGSGFSHMLQMMNQEALKNFEQKDFNSDVDDSNLRKMRLISEAQSLSKSKLPRIRNRQAVDLLNDDILNYSDEKMNTFDNKKPIPAFISPKVVKIFKKPKSIKNDTQLTHTKELKLINNPIQ